MAPGALCSVLSKRSSGCLNRSRFETVQLERTSPMLGDIMNRYRRWRTYQTTVSELARLSNRELDDLGISRADIPFVAAKSAR